MVVRAPDSCLLSTGRRRLLWGGALAAMLSGCATLPRPDAVIRGRAFTRNRFMFPPDAVFEAVLLDVTHDSEPPVALGRQRLEPAGQGPFDLAIPYASGQMQRGGKYVVQAQITLYNELIFYSPGTHPVINDPAFQRVDVVLEPYLRSKATARAAVAFEHTHWQLLGVGEDVTTGVAPPAEGAAPAFVRFQPTEAGDAASRGEFAGSGGCNRFLGSYERRGTDLRLKLGTTSIRLCLAGGGDEPAYLSALTQVRGFEQNARELTLLDQDGKALLHFRAAEAGKAAFEPYEPPNSQQ